MADPASSIDTSSSANDLAYLRSLAEAGKDAPLSAGPYLVFGGGWFAAASIVIGLADLSLIPFGREEVLPACMLGALVGFGMTLVLLVRRDARKAETNTNRAVGAAWTAAGFGIFFYFLAVQIATWRTGSQDLQHSMLLVVLLLYGSAWLVMAQVTGRRWMVGVALLTAISLFGVAALIATQAAWLAYAAALILSGVVPGAYLMHLARAARG
jgi:hypothetical protein